MARCVGGREQISGFDGTARGVSQRIDATTQGDILTASVKSILFEADSGMDAISPAQYACDFFVVGAFTQLHLTWIFRVYNYHRTLGHAPCGYLERFCNVSTVDLEDGDGYGAGAKENRIAFRLISDLAGHVAIAVHEVDGAQKNRREVR